MSTRVSPPSFPPSGLGVEIPSPDTVELAVGVLMGHFGIDQETAVHLLQTWSRQWELSTEEISRCVVATVSPHPRAVPSRHSLRSLRSGTSSVPWLPPPSGTLPAPAAGREARRRLLQLIEILDDAQ